MASARQRGVIFSYIYMAVQMIVQLIYVPLLLSTLGQSEYGLYQLVGSVMSYLVSINGVLASGVGRFYCMYKAEDDSKQMENTLAITKRIYFILAGVTALVIAVLIPIVATVYSSSFSSAEIAECGTMLVVLGVNTVVTMFNTINITTITAFEKFDFLRITQLLAVAVQPALVLGLSSVFPSAIMVCAVVLASNFVCAVLQAVYSNVFLKAKAVYHGWDSKLASSLVAFSATIVLVTIADQIFWKTDQLIVGYFYGATAVAIYAVGSQIYTAYMGVGTAVSGVFLPRVSELYHQDHDMNAISNLFSTVGRLSFLVCGAVLGCFAFAGREFVFLWAGEGYESAYWIALVVMVPFTIDIIQNVGLTVLQVMDKYLFRGLMYFTVAVINVVATIILVKNLGLVGAAYSTAVSMLLGNGLLMNYYYKKVGINIAEFWKQIAAVFAPWAAVVAVFAVAFSAFSISCDGWLGVVLCCALFLMAYFLLEWFFGLNQQEKRMIQSYLHLGGED